MNPQNAVTNAILRGLLGLWWSCSLGSDIRCRNNDGFEKATRIYLEFYIYGRKLKIPNSGNYTAWGLGYRYYFNIIPSIHSLGNISMDYNFYYY